MVSMSEWPHNMERNLQIIWLLLARTQRVYNDLQASYLDLPEPAI